MSPQSLQTSSTAPFHSTSCAFDLSEWEWLSTSTSQRNTAVWAHQTNFHIVRYYFIILPVSKQNLGQILFKRSSWRNRRTSASSASAFDFHPKSRSDTDLARCSMYSLQLFPAGLEWIIAKASASFDIFKNQSWFSLPPSISYTLEKTENNNNNLISLWLHKGN